MRPYVEQVHSLDIPSVEGALLRVFTQGTKHPRIRRVAEWIFHDQLQDAVQRIPKDIARLTLQQLIEYLYDVPELYDDPRRASTGPRGAGAGQEEEVEEEEEAQRLHREQLKAAMDNALDQVADYEGDDDDELAQLLERALEMQQQWEVEQEQQAHGDDAESDEQNAQETLDDAEREARATQRMEQVNRATFMGLKKQGGTQGPWQHWVFPEDVQVQAWRVNKYRWLATVWARINFGPLLIQYLERILHAYSPFVRNKMAQFRQQHLSLVQWIHASGARRNAAFEQQWQADPLYKPLGPSAYPDDRSYIRAQSQKVQRKQRPLEILHQHYPHIEWDPWKVAQALANRWTDDALWRLFGPLNNDNDNNGDDDREPKSVLGPYTIVYHPLRYRMLDVDALRGHSLYLACCFIISRCQVLEEELRAVSPHDGDASASPVGEADASSNDEVCDALYMYRLAFVDLFYACLSRGPFVRMDDVYLLTPLMDTKSGASKRKNATAGTGLTPWEYWYPHDTRAFHADDLPNLFSIVHHLPLNGVKRAPKVPLYHIFLKCMPFACMKRCLVKEITTACQDETVSLDELLEQESRSQRQQRKQRVQIRYCADEGFWRLFRHIMWCMLAGTYPGSRKRPGMRKLLRIKQMCENRTLLMDTLSLKSQEDQIMATLKGVECKAALRRLEKELHGNNNVIFTAFRAYYFHLIHDQPHYTGPANAHVDLTHLFQETHQAAVVIRQSNLFLQDAFAMARSEMKDNNVVYRFQQDTCARMMVEECQKYMEDTLYAGIPNYTRDLDHLTSIHDACVKLLEQDWSNLSVPNHVYNVVCMTDGHEYAHRFSIIKERLEQLLLDRTRNVATMTACRDALQEIMRIVARVRDSRQISLRHMQREMTPEVKGNILNLLSRVPPKERLSLHAFCALRFTEYGGISKQTAKIMEKLVSLHKDNPAPKDILAQLGRIDIGELRVVIWFFNCVAKLERIQFAPLHYGAIAKIQRAMTTRRYALFPGQRIPQNVYDVYYTICCNKVMTLFERNNYGSGFMSFDLERRAFVCKECNKKKRSRKKAAAAKNAKTTRPARPQGTGGAIVFEPVLDGGEEEEEEPGALAAEQEEDDADGNGVFMDADEINAVDAGAEMLACDDEDGGEGGSMAFAAEDVLQAMGKGNSQLTRLQMAEQLILDYHEQDRRNESNTVLNKRRQDARAMFLTIPCDRQPMMAIPLDGTMIMLVSKKNVRRITRCWQCAAVHEYDYHRHLGGEYLCKTCASENVLWPESGGTCLVRECALCGLGGADGRSRGGATESTARRVLLHAEHVVQIMCPWKDPDDPTFDPLEEPDRLVQTLRFCPPCYTIALRFQGLQTKEYLWETIRQKRMEKMMRANGMTMRRHFGQRRIAITDGLVEDTHGKTQRALSRSAVKQIQDAKH